MEWDKAAKRAKKSFMKKVAECQKLGKEAAESKDERGEKTRACLIYTRERGSPPDDVDELEEFIEEKKLSRKWE